MLTKGKGTSPWSIIVSGLIGGLIGIIVSFIVNSTLAEISISPFFSAVISTSVLWNIIHSSGLCDSMAYKTARRDGE